MKGLPSPNQGLSICWLSSCFVPMIYILGLLSSIPHLARAVSDCSVLGLHLGGPPQLLMQVSWEQPWAPSPRSICSLLPALALTCQALDSGMGPELGPVGLGDLVPPLPCSPLLGPLVLALCPEHTPTQEWQGEGVWPSRGVEGTGPEDG